LGIVKLFKVTSNRTTHTDPPVVVYVVARTIEDALKASPGFAGGAGVASIELLSDDVIEAGA
jgi:hypothetical protein